MHKRFIIAAIFMCILAATNYTAIYGCLRTGHHCPPWFALNRLTGVTY
jgi:hypothetical protein